MRLPAYEFHGLHPNPCIVVPLQSSLTYSSIYRNPRLASALLVRSMLM